MNNPDVETIIQILIFVVIFGAGIIQFVYRNFVKPIKEAERRRRAGGEPEAEKTIRDFLSELRGERPQGAEPDRAEVRGGEAQANEGHGGAARGAEARREEEARPRRDLIWEVVEPVPAPQAPRPVVPPLVREVVHGERAAERRGVRGGRRRAARAQGQRPVQEAAGGVPARPAGGGSPAETSEGERRATAHVAKTFAQSLGAMASAPEALGMRAAGRSLGALGIGLREAILAQVVFGPPRAFHRRGGSGLAGGRHGGRVRP